MVEGEASGIWRNFFCCLVGFLKFTKVLLFFFHLFLTNWCPSFTVPKKGHNSHLSVCCQTLCSFRFSSLKQLYWIERVCSHLFCSLSLSVISSPREAGALLCAAPSAGAQPKHLDGAVSGFLWFIGAPLGAHDGSATAGAPSAAAARLHRCCIFWDVIYVPLQHCLS